MCFFDHLHTSPLFRARFFMSLEHSPARDGQSFGNESFVTEREAAAFLGISVCTLQRWRTEPPPGGAPNFTSWEPSGWPIACPTVPALRKAAPFIRQARWRQPEIAAKKTPDAGRPARLRPCLTGGAECMAGNPPVCLAALRTGITGMADILRNPSRAGGLSSN